MYVCVCLGVVFWDLGSGVPGTFSFARTLVFGTINPKYLENGIQNITNKAKAREAITNNNGDINNNKKNKRNAHNKQQQHDTRTNKIHSSKQKMSKHMVDKQIWIVCKCVHARARTSSQVCLVFVTLNLKSQVIKIQGP